MKLLLGAMCRTGMNAIGRWLLRQSDLADQELKYVHEGWVEYNNSYMYMTMINHKEHNLVYQSIIDEYKPEDLIMTVERDRVESFKHYHNLHPNFKPIIIIREFKNWVASVCRMGALNFGTLYKEDVVKYAEFIKDTEYFKIKYDHWCTDQAYRTYICNQLNLKFTDCGFNVVSPNGNGSSFDGMKFQGRASEMKTTERYKEFESNGNFQVLLDKYKEALELSNEFFK